MRVPSSSRSNRILVGSCLLALTGVVACSKANTDAARSDTAGATSATGANMTTTDTTAMAGNTQAAAMGDSARAGNITPDQDFLQKMSDHHKGLVLMTHETAEFKGPLTVKGEAKKLDAEQDDDLDRMGNALKSDFNVTYTPRVLPENQAMVDSLGKLSGAAYDRQFLQNVVQHHQKSLDMIDSYMPRFTRADVKAMATRMRAMQAREIQQYKQQLARS